MPSPVEARTPTQWGFVLLFCTNVVEAEIHSEIQSSAALGWNQDGERLAL